MFRLHVPTFLYTSYRIHHERYQSYYVIIHYCPILVLGQLFLPLLRTNKSELGLILKFMPKFELHLVHLNKFLKIHWKKFNFYVKRKKKCLKRLFYLHEANDLPEARLYIYSLQSEIGCSLRFFSFTIIWKRQRRF